ncbi:MAG: hypothetical protein ACRDT0_10750, partial [Pseudonocardiaceae bacterium]
MLIGTVNETGERMPTDSEQPPQNAQQANGTQRDRKPVPDVDATANPTETASQAIADDEPRSVGSVMESATPTPSPSRWRRKQTISVSAALVLVAVLIVTAALTVPWWSEER